MKHLKLFSITAICMVTLLFTVQAIGSDDITFSGQVIDENNAAVSGVTVYLYKSSGFNLDTEEKSNYLITRTICGEDGQFFFEHIAPSSRNTFIITAVKPGLSFGGCTYSYDRDPDNPRIMLTTPETVSGKIIDKDNKLIQNARVAGVAQLNQPENAYVYPDKQANILTATADSNGEFTLMNLPKNSQLRLTIEADGYARRRVAGSGKDYFLIKSGASGLVYTLVPEGKITGAIIDQESGNKITSLPLYCWSGGTVFRAKYDRQGNFIFEGLNADKYAIGMAGLFEHSVEYTLPVKKDVAVSEGECVNVSMELAKPGWVTGKVTDVQTGKPLKNVVVVFTNRLPLEETYPSNYLLSAEDGTYKITLPP